MKSGKFYLLCAVHLFLVNGDKILLLRRFNTGYEDGNFSVPAGHLEENETVKQATTREACEEVGIQILPEDLEIVQALHRKTEQGERIDYFLCCGKWDGQVTNMETHKCDLLEWHPVKQLPSNVVPYVAHSINNYLQGVKFDEFGFYLQK